MCDGMSCDCGGCDCGGCGGCDCCSADCCTPCESALSGCCEAVGQLISGCCNGLSYIFCCGCCDETVASTSRSSHEGRGDNAPSALYVPMIVTDPHIPVVDEATPQPANTNIAAEQQRINEEQRMRIQQRYGIAPQPGLPLGYGGDMQQAAAWQQQAVLGRVVDGANLTRTDGLFPPR